MTRLEIDDLSDRSSQNNCFDTKKQTNFEGDAEVKDE